MDRLKDFIEMHREAFEEEQLPEGHLERFEQKLVAPRKRRGMLYSLCALAAAACIALLLLFRGAGSGSLPVSPEEEVARETGVGMKEEIEGLRLYYNMQMSDILLRMQALYKQQRTPGTEELLNETKRVLADSHQFEETVLPTLPRSNAALYAMNLHYSTSIESLHLMLEQMERMKSSGERQEDQLIITK